MPRFRFTVRRMMVVVAVAGGILASIAALTRKPRDPENALEALAHVTRKWAHGARLEDYDVQVRRWHPDRPAPDTSQSGVIFIVELSREDARGRGHKQTVYVMQGGYCMQVAIGSASEPK